MNKVSLTAQIDAVRRLRNGEKIKLTASQKELFGTHLDAALQTLSFVQANEAAIRAFVAEKRGQS